MGGKIYFRTVLLALALAISFSLSSFFVLSVNKCCVTTNPYTCQDVALESECEGGVINLNSCSNIANCNMGCCCSLPGPKKYVTKGFCTLENGFSLSNEGQQGLSDGACAVLCSNQNMPSCSYTSCDGQNTNTCLCGSKIINSSVATDDYCCAASSQTFSSQNTCQISPPCSAASAFFKINGRVVDSKTSDPLFGVSVSASKKAGNVFSAADGTFAITSVPAGNGTITATFPGYETVYRNYTLTSSDIDIVISMINKSISEICTITTGDADKDGCIAMYDASCNATPGYKSEGTRHLCSDGTDNDCDGLYDCYDPDCFNDASCNAGANHSFCGDGKIDTPNYFGVSEECESGIGCQNGASCVNCKCILTQPTCGDGNITGDEECDPYAPQTEWNCQNGQICNPINCLCLAEAGGCGNAQFNLGEECEFTDQAYTDTLSGSYCSASQCIKPGKPGACLCKTKISCGNYQLDPNEECDLDAGSCPSGVCNYATCTCESCNADDKSPGLILQANTTHSRLNWDVFCTSPSPKNYTLGRCAQDSSNQSCTPAFYKLLGTSNSYAEALGDYCYSVTAVYSPTEQHSSNIVCIKKPVFSCTISDEYDYFCDENSVTQCIGGEKNVIQNCTEISDQANTYTCLDFPHIGPQNAECVLQSACEQCNGWYSMFSAVGMSVYGVDINNHIGNISCKDVLTCYLDSTKTSVDKYYGCKDFSSCYDYKSQSSCEENKCKIGECEWLSSSRFEEFGIGVCRPKDVEKQDCRRCGENSFNRFFGGCTKEYCALFGEECYFDSSTSNFNGLPFNRGCINKFEMACDYYGDADNCIGGVNSSLNTTWNYAGLPPSPKNPQSGSNTHLVSSKDALKIGLCVWDGQSCFKDGNGDKKRDCINAQSGDISCMQDVTPPSSSIGFLNPVKNDLSIFFGISDDSVSKRKYFHFNIVPKGESCYPNGTFPGQKVIELKENETSGVVIYDMASKGYLSGNYTFCYFAQDASHNFETLKAALLNVDADLPQVNYSISTAPYEIWKEPFGPQDYEWVTNLTVRVILKEYAYCSLWLSKQDETGPVGGISITNNYLNDFTIDYTALQDGDYAFHAHCFDAAGNKNTDDNRTIYFKIDADKQIEIIGPNKTFGPNDEIGGKITINLAVKTNSSAICRFSPSTKNYDSMTQFSSTGATTHLHTLTYPDNFVGDGVKNYFVRCQFSGNSRIYGNDGDTITFGIDYTPPTTSFVNSEGQKISVNDALWYRRNDLSNIYIKCEDPEMRYAQKPENKDWASGCKDARYSFSPTTIPVSRGKTFSQVELPSGNGIFELWYHSLDSAGNKEVVRGPKILKVDDEQYKFEFRIFNSLWKEIDTVTWGKTYTVYVNTTKNFQDASYSIYLDDLGFYVGSKRYTLSDITVDSSTIGEPNRGWFATLRLDTADPNLEGLDNQEATFFVNSHDDHGLFSTEISAGNTFFIDTTSPQVPGFDPAFEEEMPKNFEFYYPALFHAYSNKYYTNEKSLFVTGRTEEKGFVSLFLNDQSTPFKTYDQSQNADEQPLSSKQTIDNALKGQNSLLFDGDISSVFKQGNYILVEGKERESYTHYREYYKITGSQVIGDGGDATTKVFIEPDLEFDAQVGSRATVYNKKYPFDWFGGHLSLLLGKNTLSAKLADSIGNKANTPIYELYYDPYAPEIKSAAPRNNTVIGDKYMSIKVIVEEQGEGLQNDTIKMKINGNLVDLSIDYTQAKIQVDGGETNKYTYSITYANPDGFEDGVYRVEFEASDFASHKISHTWSFEIDTRVPTTPEFALVGANKSENYDSETDTWFTSTVKNFTLDFPDNADVIITKVNLYGVAYDEYGLKGKSGLKETNVTECKSIDINLFLCSFKNPSLVSADAEYALKIYSYKLLDNGTSTEGNYEKFFTMDTITPAYSLIYKNVTSSDANVTFTASVKNPGEKRLRAFIEVEGEPKVELVPMFGVVSGLDYLYTKPYSFSWDVPDKTTKEYQFTFYLKDLAGNQNSSEHKIRIDNEMPWMKIENITTNPIYILNLTPYIITNLQELEMIAEENARFAGNAINIAGEIASDANKVTVTKRRQSGELFDDAEPPLVVSKCFTPQSKNNCFYNGSIYINNYQISGIPGEDTANYLLFEVEDEAENIAYYTLVLVSDLTSPTEPEIQIIE